MNNMYIIWGAGEFGKLVIKYLGVDRVSAVIDASEDKWGKEIGGIKIMSPEVGLSQYLDEVIVICVPEQYTYEIEKNLKKMGRRTISRIELRTYVMVCDYEEKMGSFLGTTDWKCDEKSEVEFYLVDSFEINHFIPLYRELIKLGIKARFVCEAPIINPYSFGFDYNEAIGRLKRENIDYSTLCNPYAKVAVTTQFAYCLSKYKNVKIEMSYGVALLKNKAFQLNKNVIKEFDYAFVHGKYQKSIIDKYLPKEHVIDISYPRYIKKISYTKEALIKKYNLDSGKKTLVYLPTWDEHSSISKYAKLIGELKEEYNVIVKPHHCTTKLESKNKDYNILKDSFSIILDSKLDIREAAMLGDIFICDAKSAVCTELAFLNKKSSIILIYEKCSADEFWFPLNRYYEGISTVEEFKSKKDKFKLEDDLYLEVRNDWIEQLYSSDVEEGIKRAVDKIKEICDK